MRRTATLLTGVLLLTCLASTAMAQRYKYPPGPPYRSCPDTLTIFDVQQPDTLIAPCHPATLDTVWGVKGTITGFDLRASSFAIYIQTNNSLGWNGVNVFTGATNYAGSPYNLVIGDEIAVYGTTQEFPASNGETELEGPDANQSTNDIIVRKISSGNPVPPYFVATTTQLRWIPGNPGNLGEQYEGTLVKIRGPLKVGRVGSGLGLFNNNWLLYNPANPADSVMIDGFTLPPTAIGNPTVGATVDSVQGILNQRNGQGGINSYRIQLRNGNDQFFATPPNLSDAFPVEDNKLRLVFDRNVDVATAQNAGNYSLASAIDGSTVDAAVVVGGSGSVVELTITTVRVDGDAETITVGGVGSQTCPTCLISPQQSLNFIQGVLDIVTIQTPNTASFPTADRSRYAGPGTAQGTRLSYRGVATGQFGSLFYMQDPGGGLRSGLSVFGPSATLVPGRQYLIAGRVQEFDFETEIVNTVYIVDEGPVTPIGTMFGNISVLTDTTVDVSGSASDPVGNLLTGEDYECTLVKLEGVHITENRTLGQSFFASGFAEVGGPGIGDTILVSNLNGALNAYDPPDSMTRMDITGAIHYANGRFRICPRSAADIVEYGLLGVSDGSVALDFAVGPNPGRTARVRFALPTARLVDIGVFDLAGRRIATLAKGEFVAGRHTLEWNGLDASGKRAGAGMYFYRAALGSDVRTTRAVLID